MIHVHAAAAREGWRAVWVGALALLGLYALVLDQGFLLALIQGASAFEVNLIHEFVHDARHAAGFPCH